MQVKDIESNIGKPVIAHMRYRGKPLQAQGVLVGQAETWQHRDAMVKLHGEKEPRQLWAVKVELVK